MRVVHSKAPLRLGLAGGGTDVSPYSDQFGGLVLNATISLSTHVHIRFLNEEQVVFEATDFNVKEVLPLSREFELSGSLILHRAVYNKIVDKFNNGKPLPIHVVSYSDAPPGSGVGSSSALVVALVQAYQELLSLPLGEYDIAHLAYEIERIDCNMSGGKQDQYAAAFGGFNFMEFHENDNVIVNPLRIKEDIKLELESRLLLYHTGKSRESAKIIEQQIEATKHIDGVALNAMHEIRTIAVKMKELLLKGDVITFLEVLGQSWNAKKSAASGISNQYIDEIALAAVLAGASSLKISGAGGGGFMMIAVSPENRNNVVRALSHFSGQFFSFKFVESGVKSWKSN
ncbi:GHMP family kinase ATP-binding protein [Shewanella baltica]|uniref:GHMP family kinase ATP-binding protein n=1 Tax=Shewanella baltica TaxID=62322 RepID=UPI0001E4B7CA|nr:dehydrogenase [Shewanella baltica]AEG10753.1 GHMP kinase [Shewanella baltica BA175]MCS6180484.1 dehydrogenase [Shewanella baltica]MCS6256708.1 dehydrogenase [Shewanella baltica]